MNEKTLEEIDYYRIRNQAADYCLSEESRDEFLKRNPFTDKKQIEKYKNLSREWAAYTATANSSPLSSWQPVHNLFSIIKTRGANLNREQVHALGQFILSAKKVKESVSLHQTDLKLKYLPEQTALIPDFSEPERLIFRVITADGEIRELPEIAAIHKQIASLNTRLKTIMREYTSDQKLAGVLESSVPVLRNGRQVLAVKASQQNRIPGIVHEVSQTAQTIYIEPEEAVRCSNELVQKENELLVVIKRILTELTESLQPSIPLFKTAFPIMKLLDQTLAAAKWGNANDCIYAMDCETSSESPVLLKARHPLLEDKAVPIDLRFLPGKRILIITGPNTGGKTVTLKTFALFAMLNQAGLPVPAAEGTRLPVFKSIFADIGDSQSMDMQLSTFSGHMKNIAQAAHKATSESLVLLDELGSGTDPLEGSAIAMAVLDRLIEKQAFVLVTTHMGILKNYGYSSPSCINASVEFNADTLSPSFRLLMGVPGESHALDIAVKSGLPTDIVKKARNYITTEQADVSGLIKGLNKKHAELDRLQSQAHKIESEFNEKMLKLKEKELVLRRRENDLKKGRQQELNDFLIHSRRTLENLVRTLKEGELTKEKTKGVKTFIAELSSETDRLIQKIDTEDEKISAAETEFAKELKENKHKLPAKKTKRKLSNAEALALVSPVITAENIATPTAIKEEKLTFCEGAAITAGANKNEGILIKQERKGVWQVQFGSVRMTMKEKDMKLVKRSENISPDVSVDYASGKDAELPQFELRLLGMRADEAIKAVEHQIDLASLHNFPHFSIIHGKGNGILQQAVRDYLSHCPAVKEFEYAPAEDGGAGKTYVTLQ